MSTYGYNINQWKHFGAALLLILMPMLCIVLQRETGSALVYLAFFLMFYREGMPGSILFTGVALVVYFVVGIRYAEVYMFDSPTSVGKFVVMLLIQLFSIGMVWVYCNRQLAIRLLMGCLAATVVLLLLMLVPLDIVYLQLGLTVVLIFYLVWLSLASRIRNYLFIALFALGSVGFFYGADFIMQNVMEPHQRSRINVLLGLDEDLRGAGYNVHQSEIAIGSGGLEGKGFLNGTQTKLKFVPEQDTDFIFCTVGEEEGFLGSAGVLLLFLALILRLLYLSERQPFRFGRIYGYSVLSIFLFHVFINVGMVLGLTPVIGIPLPFFSYGGSSLWGFTLLLFIFLRIDASRNLMRS
jgi:rod shape determining protein RodA